MSRSRASKEFSENPLAWLAMFFAAGILLGGAVGGGPFVFLAVATILAFAGLASRRPGPGTFFIFLAFAAGGAAAYTFEQQGVSSNRLRAVYDSGLVESGSPVEVGAVLAAEPEAAPGGYFIVARAHKLMVRDQALSVSGNVRLFVAIGTAPGDVALRYGSSIIAACSLEREDEYRNPGVLLKREALDRMGIDAVCVVKDEALIEHVADESVFLPLAWTYGQRSRVIATFRERLDARSAGVMIASLLGNRHFLDKETADLFREGGTFHILVISGLHITFIGGLLLLFVKVCTSSRRIQFAITASVLWAYTFAVGAELPVVRAALMFTAVHFAYVLHRRSQLPNALGLCALTFLAWRPSDLFGPSFLLTFCSIGSILGLSYPLLLKLKKIGRWVPTPGAPMPPRVPGFVKRFAETLYWNDAIWKIESKRQIWSAGLFKTPYLPRIGGTVRQSVLRYLFEGVTTSVIVSFSMLPLTVVYFHRVSAAGILLNIWVGVLIAAESFAAVLALALEDVSPLVSEPFFRVAWLCNEAMLVLPRLFTGSELASFRLPAYTGSGRIVYVLFATAIAALAWPVYRWDPFDRKRGASRTRKKAAAAMGFAVITGAIIVFHPLSGDRADGRLRVDFLDVGQGDAALVTYPDGQTMLVDGGGRLNDLADDETDQPFEPDVRTIGEAVTSEFLWSRGLSSIDYIVATHADADHIQGLTDVVRNFEIGSAMAGSLTADDPDLAKLVSVLEKRGVPLSTVARGDRMEIGGAVVEVFWPEGVPGEPADNDHSIVLRITFGQCSFFLTGDIERRAEAALASTTDLTANVVKAAHHGSRTSSTAEFVDAVKPAVVVVSVGRRSQFGHPHRDVMDRWAATGAEVLTTGASGTISISTDGIDLQLSEFAPGM